VKILSQMLDFCGVEKDRVRLRWVSSAEANEFIDEVDDYAKVLKELGPSPLKNKQVKKPA